MCLSSTVVCSMITLTHLEIVDLALRLAASGQLALLIYWFGQYKPKTQKRAYQFFVLCIISYILLTTPIANEDYGWLRAPLLLLTDLTAFSVWYLVLKILKPQRSLMDYPKWLTVPVGLWCVWLAYFFLFTPGKGVLHDASHVIGFVVLGYVIFRCLHGYFDDLVDERRSARLIIVTGCGIYMAVLTFFELAFRFVKDLSLFSLLNALTIALLSFIFSAKYIKPSAGDRLVNEKTTSSEIKETSSRKPPRSVNAEKLDGLMESGIYRQPDFSVSALSEAAGIPQHQLRKLINQELGFTNFSHYLNSYRIPEVCRQLENAQQQHIPILTLALEAGFNSIAPFNRAFKHHMGITPKQYRERFQK